MVDRDQAISNAIDAYLAGPDPIHESFRRALAEQGWVVVPLADYQRLLLAAESDDMIVTCETCGAWLDLDDPATCKTDEYTGCWKVGARRKQDEHLCRSYRAMTRAAEG